MKKLIYSFIVLLTAIGMSGCGDDDLGKELEGTWTCADATGIRVMRFFGNHEVTVYNADYKLNIVGGSATGEYTYKNNIIRFYGIEKKYGITKRLDHLVYDGITYKSASYTGVTLTVNLNDNRKREYTKH